MGQAGVRGGYLKKRREAGTTPLTKYDSIPERWKLIKKAMKMQLILSHMTIT